MLFQKLTEAARSAPRSGISEGGLLHTYDAMLEPISRLAGGFAARGIEPGDTVALLLPNSIALFEVTHALFALGAVALPLNPAASPRELELAARRCGVKAIVAGGRSADAAHTLASHLAPGIPVYRSDASDDNSLEALKRYPVPSLAPIDPDSHAIYLSSSGSTGRPKTVAFTQRTVLDGGLHSTGLLGITPEDRAFNSLPSFTSFGFLTFVGGEMLRGGTTILWSDPQPLVMSRSRMLEAMAAEAITVLPGVPFLYDLLVSAPEDVDLGRIRMAYSSGVAMRKPTFDAFLSRYRIPIRQAYGSTETAMVSLNTESDATATWDTVGMPLMPVSVEVVPAPGMPDTGVGELFVKKPGLTPGYIGGDAASLATMKNGGWMTGDLGFIGEDGLLRVTGRSKLIIEVAGMKVDPIEIEDALVSHPAVEEAAVLGVPDPRTGEQQIKAVVVLKDDATAAVLLRHVRGKLAAYKVPALLEFRDALPRSGSGKILRGQLLD